MAFAERLFRRGGAPQVDLSALQVQLTAGVAWWSGRPADPDLVGRGSPMAAAMPGWTH